MKREAQSAKAEAICCGKGRFERKWEDGANPGEAISAIPLFRLRDESIGGDLVAPLE
jgi:hypothetical protein